MIHICLLCHVRNIFHQINIHQQYFNILSKFPTLICPLCHLGKASLSTTVSTYGQIFWCKLLTTWEKIWQGYLSVLHIHFGQSHHWAKPRDMLLQVRRKPSCECKWKKRWCGNEKWYFYPCSFCHNAVLTEVLHLMIINDVLISIQTIVRVNLICHWIPYELYCINQPYKHIQVIWAPVGFF